MKTRFDLIPTKETATEMMRRARDLREAAFHNAARALERQAEARDLRDLQTQNAPQMQGAVRLSGCINCGVCGLRCPRLQAQQEEVASQRGVAQRRLRPT